MTDAPRCPSCSGPHLTAPLDVRASGYDVHFKVSVKDGSWLGKDHHGKIRARVCVACGYILMIAAPDAVAWLQQHVRPESEP